MTTLFDNLVSGGGATYFGNLNAAPSSGTAPTITALSGPVRFLGTLTITGTEFGASQGVGSVRIGGVVQPVLSWSDTSIEIGPIARSALRYGSHSLVVANNSLESSAAYAVTLLPQVGWNYVNLVAPLASSGQRIIATPDLQPGWQVAWGDVSPAGTVTVATNGSFTTDGIVGTFYAEVHDGTVWGSTAAQTLNDALFTGTLQAARGRVTGTFVVGTANPQFSGSLQAAPGSMGGTFAVFVGVYINGALQARPATLNGAFTVTAPGSTSPIVVTPTPLSGGTVDSKVGIANLALIKIGARPIRRFTDDTKSARLLRQVYDRILVQELSRRWWNFATARTLLPETLSADEKGPYQYRYGLPVDWLTTMMVGDTPPSVRDDNFEADEWSHEGRAILTHYPPPLAITYIRRVTDPTHYHALFIEALACRLAMELCKPMTGSFAAIDGLRFDYRNAIMEAARVDAVQDPPRRLHDDANDSWLTARH